jgi:hypothetical protein
VWVARLTGDVRRTPHGPAHSLRLALSAACLCAYSSRSQPVEVLFRLRIA